MLGRTRNRATGYWRTIGAQFPDLPRGRGVVPSPGGICDPGGDRTVGQTWGKHGAAWAVFAGKQASRVTQRRSRRRWWAVCSTTGDIRMVEGTVFVEEGPPSTGFRCGGLEAGLRPRDPGVHGSPTPTPSGSTTTCPRRPPSKAKAVASGARTMVTGTPDRSWTTTRTGSCCLA
jgi:hypothetical protein